MLLETANIIFFLICTTKNVENAVFDKFFIFRWSEFCQSIL